MKLPEKTVPEVHVEFIDSFVVKGTKRHFKQVPADHANFSLKKSIEFCSTCFQVVLQGH